MRRLILSALVLALGIAVTGCGDETKPTGPPVRKDEIDAAMKAMKAKGKDAQK